MITSKDKNSVNTFISAILSKRNLSQTAIANYLGCTPQYVNQIIRGTKTDKNGRNLVAQTLGFINWNHLVAESNKFWDEINLGIDFLEKRQSC